MKKKLFFVIGIILLLVILVFTFNGIVVLSSKNRIINIDKVNNIDNVDAILVLGCKVNPDGTPSMMLTNRVEKGIELYEKTGIKILLSGDHDTKGYDEVNTMKDMVNAPLVMISNGSSRKGKSQWVLMVVISILHFLTEKKL